MSLKTPYPRGKDGSHVTFEVSVLRGREERNVEPRRCWLLLFQPTQAQTSSKGVAGPPVKGKGAKEKDEGGRGLCPAIDPTPNGSGRSLQS